MISSCEGNVLNVEKGVIVHGCNAQGVMGSGIALEVKNRFPEVFEAYRKTYILQGHKLHLGQIIPVKVAEGKWIVNAITQEFAGRDPVRYVTYDGMAMAFENIVKDARLVDALKSGLFFPLIGAGLANGSWPIIERIIDVSVPDTIEKTLYIYKP
jgi:O-acetyl-ADP-ribose deacetylase (regulator of RNase III)